MKKLAGALVLAFVLMFPMFGTLTLMNARPATEPIEWTNTPLAEVTAADAATAAWHTSVTSESGGISDQLNPIVDETSESSVPITRILNVESDSSQIAVTGDVGIEATYPDLIVTELWWEDAYGSDYAGLTSGQPFSVRITVKNQGDAAAGSFSTWLRINDPACWTLFSVDSLAAGASYSRTFLWLDLDNWISTLGTAYISASVDEYRAVTESVETNNLMTKYVEVSAAEWTVLSYLDGDNTVEGAMVAKYDEMKLGGSTPDLSIFAKMDRHPYPVAPYGTNAYGDWMDCKGFFITHDLDPTDENALKQYGEVDMGSEYTLFSFLSWGVSRFAANHYYVMIHDHGNAWKGCCVDETSSSEMSLIDLGSALSGATIPLDRKIDVLLLDCCLMGSVEVMTQLFTRADYIIASETSVDSGSYVLYEDNLISDDHGSIWWLRDQLADYGYANPIDLAINTVVEATEPDDDEAITQSNSAYDTSLMDAFVDSLDGLVDNMLMEMDDATEKAAYIQSRGECIDTMGLYLNDFDRVIDLYQFAEKVYAYSSDPDVKAYADDIMTRIGVAGGAVGSLVMIEVHSESAIFCNGLSVYYPSTYELYSDADYSNYRTSGNFVSQTTWDEFLLGTYDTAAPTNPNAFTSSHQTSVWSKTSQVSVSWSGATDALSGVYGYSYLWDHSSLTTPDSVVDTLGTSVTTSQSDGTWYLHIRARDNGGNWASGAYHIGPFLIDTVPPTTSASLAGTLGSNGWYKSTVTVTLSATDTASGVAWKYYSIDSGGTQTYTAPFVVSEGTHTVYYHSVDVAGNVESTKSTQVKVDTVAPTTSASLSGTVGSNGWYKSSVTVTLTRSDATSGIQYTMYKIDGGTWTTYSAAFVVSGDLQHTVYFYSVDNAGNIETTKSTSVKIDTTPPTTSSTVSGDSVILTATDATSGVQVTYFRIDAGQWQAYSLPFSVGEGTSIVDFYSIDNAGNSESIQTIQVVPDQPVSVLVEDSFEDLNGWSIINTGGFVGLDTSRTAIDKPSLKVAKEWATGGSSATYYFESQTGRMYVEVKMKVATTCTASEGWAYVLVGTGQVTFCFEQGYLSWYSDSTGFVRIMTFAVGTTYRIAFDIDIQSGVYDIYVDGVLKRDNALLRGTPGSPIDRLSFQAGWFDAGYGTTLWADDVLVGSGAPPSAPTNLAASLAGMTVVLTWGYPLDDGGELSGYKIYRSTKSGAEAYYATVVGDVRTYTDLGAAAGKTYYYKVLAYNSLGDGPLSGEVTVKVPRTLTALVLDTDSVEGAMDLALACNVDLHALVVEELSSSDSTPWRDIGDR